MSGAHWKGRSMMRVLLGLGMCSVLLSLSVARGAEAEPVDQERVRELRRKVRSGEKLTPEEEEYIKRAREAMRKRRGERGGRGRERQGRRGEREPRQRGGKTDSIEPMQAKTFKSEALGAEHTYFVYLPPSYEKEPARRYPVVYFLHGATGGPKAAVPHSANIDAAIKAGKAPEMIVVGVDGMAMTMWTDSRKSKRKAVESALVKDLVPHIDATYRTIPAREARMLEGRSMGGYGAAFIGFKYPETFGAVSSLCSAMHRPEFLKSDRASIFNGTFAGDMEYCRANSPWTLVEKNADRIRGKVLIRLCVGTKDTACFRKNQDYHKLLEKLKIEHGYVEVKGAGHDMKGVWRGLDDPCAFYRKAFANLKGAGRGAPGREDKGKGPQEKR